MPYQRTIPSTSTTPIPSTRSSELTAAIDWLLRVVARCITPTVRAGRRPVCVLLTLAFFVSCSQKPDHSANTAPRAAAPPSPLKATYTTQDHDLDVQSFEYVWTTIRDKHWDPTLGGLDWQAVHDELHPKLEQATSRQAARAIMSDMIHRLKQSHFNIVPASAYEDQDAAASSENVKDAKPSIDRPQAKGEGSTGIDVRVLDGRPVVTRVTPGSPADAAGVKIGWIIDTIGGHPLAARLERVSTIYAASSMKEFYLSATILAELSGQLGDELAVEFLAADDARVKTNIKLGSHEGTPAQFGNLPTTYVTIDSSRLPQNIHYFRLSIFFDPPKVTQALTSAVKDAAGTDGFIIDLRGNPGGIGAMALGVASWFVEEPNLKLGTMYSRSGNFNFNVNPRLNGYRGPLAVLIDGMSASTSEILAGGLMDIKRARVFGTKSAGAALPSTFEVLPNDDRFQYAVANYISSSGQTLEAVGVMPDEVVPLDRATLLTGKDPVMQAAIAWIKSQPTNPKPMSSNPK